MPSSLQRMHGVAASHYQFWYWFKNQKELVRTLIFFILQRSHAFQALFRLRTLRLPCRNCSEGLGLETGDLSCLFLKQVGFEAFEHSISRSYFRYGSFMGVERKV